MKKVFLSLAISLFCITTYSQATRAAFEMEMIGRNGIIKSLNHVSENLTYSEIKGSPYLNDEFLPSEIIMPDGRSYNEVPLRYNIYSNNIEFKNSDGEVMEIVEPQRYQQFNLENKSFKYLNYATGNRIEQSYFQVLASGKTLLLKRYKISYRPEEPAKPFKDPVPPKFVNMQSDLYISSNDLPAEKISNNAKALELLKQQKPDISAWAKKEKLKFNKEEDLIKLVEYCNQ